MKRIRIEDPKNDLLFKYIFGKDDDISKKLLKVLIEGALSIQVKELTIMNPELSPSHIEDRDLILDIKAKDEKGKIYDIEMQCYGPSKRFYRRFAQYGHKLAGEVYKEGDLYLEQKKVYQILFIDSLNPYSNKLIRKMNLKDDDGVVDEEDPLVKTYIYIKQMKEYEPWDVFKSLVYLFNHPDECDKIKTGNEMISMVADKINEFNEDEEMADLAYRRKLDQIFKNTLEVAEKEAQQRAEEAEQKAEERAEERAKEMAQKINLLNQKLLENNRIDDLKRASTDPSYQKQLFKEFELE